MTIEEIKKYLNKKNESLDEGIYQEIEEHRQRAISNGNEKDANYCWCIRQIYLIQKEYLSAYYSLKNSNFDSAWHALEQTEIKLSSLEKNFGENDDYIINSYNLPFIKKAIINYEKLFPYFLYISREFVIKKEECSICGQTAGIRNGCKHIPGNLYMGEICCRIVRDFEPIGFALVKDPFDKYGVIKVEGQEYNYSMLETLMPNINSPYEIWDIEEIPMIKPEYKSIGRNDPCPCGSNTKYKKCCLGTKRIYGTHYKIHINIPHKKELEQIKYINTWKE